jgi:hypothetical protein
VQAQCLWPDQALYELVRPVVLLGKPIRERARETGVSEKTLSRRAHQFIQHGLPGFRAPPGLRDDDGRLLPSAMRDFILVRKAEWPALSAFALARLCAVRFDRETSYRAVARLLVRESLPSGVARRFHATARSQIPKNDGWPSFGCVLRDGRTPTSRSI